MAENVLSISTNRARRRVSINGTEYLMRDIDELSLADTVLLRQISEGMAKFPNGDLMMEEVAALMDQLKLGIARILPAVPKETADALTDRQRLDILNVFCSAQLAAPDQAGASDSAARCGG